MKRAFLANLSLNLLLTSRISKSSYPFVLSSTRPRLGFYSSESRTPNFNPTQKPNGSVEDVDAVSDQELKKRIEKYYEGDENEIPAIFEAILKRKLAGISDDDELIEALGPKVKDDDSEGLPDSDLDMADDHK